MIRLHNLRLPLDYTEEDLKKAAARALGLPLTRIRRAVLSVGRMQHCP